MTLIKTTKGTLFINKGIKDFRIKMDKTRILIKDLISRI